jgi:predicted GNAT family acetyltransferase
MIECHDNPKASRYEATVEGQVCVVEYHLNGATLTINHVGVPKLLEGRGIAKRMMDAVYADAKARGLTIVPVCSYAAAYMQRRKA